MIGLLDCGTTNTKFYLLEEQAILAEEYETQGIKNFGGLPDKTSFQAMIGAVIQRAVKKAGRTLDALETVVAFGMITSEIGLVELPHLLAPAGTNDLHGGVHVLEGQTILPCMTKFVFIPGVRLVNGDMNDLSNVLDCDFMRGEETQSLGVAASYPASLPINVLFLSSHTKMVYINEAGQIEKSVTTLSGQLFEVLCRHTILEKSIPVNITEIPAQETLEEMYALAKRCIARDGFLRAIMIPRFMEVFTARTALERRLFLEAAIVVEDCKALDRYFESERYYTKNHFIIGHDLRSRLYELALREKLGKEIQITRLVGKDAVKAVTIAGAMQIINRRKEEEPV